MRRLGTSNKKGKLETEHRMLPVSGPGLEHFVEYVRRIARHFALSAFSGFV